MSIKNKIIFTIHFITSNHLPQKTYFYHYHPVVQIIDTMKRSQLPKCSNHLFSRLSVAFKKNIPRRIECWTQITYLSFTAALHQKHPHKMCRLNKHVCLVIPHELFAILSLNSESLAVAFVYSFFVENCESLMAHIITKFTFLITITIFEI